MLQRGGNRTRDLYRLVQHMLYQRRSVMFRKTIYDICMYIQSTLALWTLRYIADSPLIRTSRYVSVLASTSAAETTLKCIETTLAITDSH